MGRSATGGEKLNKAETKKQAVMLRKSGRTHRQIAAQLNKSPGWICKLLKEAVEDYNKETAAEVEELRAWEGQRLDQMLQGIWPQVINGHLGAIDRALRVIQERARLYGLYAPSKVAPTNPDGSAEFGGGLAALLRGYESDGGNSH